MRHLRAVARTEQIKDAGRNRPEAYSLYGEDQ
jgi:hypothetical protein